MLKVRVPDLVMLFNELLIVKCIHGCVFVVYFGVWLVLCSAASQSLLDILNPSIRNTNHMNSALLHPFI